MTEGIPEVLVLAFGGASAGLALQASGYVPRLPLPVLLADAIGGACLFLIIGALFWAPLFWE